MKNLSNQLKTITSKSNLIPFLVGPHGAGKTSFIKDWSKSQGKTCITINLSAVEAVELTGMPTITDGRMTYARPFFYDYDVLFLDELNRVSDSSVKSALLSLFVDRSINGHRYGGVIIAAGNDGEGYDVYELDPAFKDRLVTIQFTPDASFLPKDFREYVKDNNLFDKFSLRRLTEASKFLDNKEVLGLILSPIVAAGWMDFMSKKEKREETLENIFERGLGELEKKAVIKRLASYKEPLTEKMTSFIVGLDAEGFVVLMKELEETKNHLIMEKLAELVATKQVNEAKRKIIIDALEIVSKG